MVSSLGVKKLLSEYGMSMVPESSFLLSTNISRILRFLTKVINQPYSPAYMLGCIMIWHRVPNCSATPRACR